MLGVTAALRHITLRAPATGRVVGYNLNSGDRVRRGQVVAHIINRELEAAQAGLGVAEQLDPEEAGKLGKSVEKYARGKGIAVAAPDNAIVAQRLVSSGQMVADLDPLADLIDPASVYVQAAVPIDAVRFVKPGMTAVVTSQLRPGVEFPARLIAISPAFEANSATATARLEFVSQPRIEDAGVAVEARVISESVPNAIVIPASALFQDAQQGGFYVFVAGTDGLAHRTRVEVGIRSPEQVQVSRGLKAGQLVITSGGYALSDGLKIQPLVAQN